MASTINATPTSSGLISSADNSGVLALQTGGTTAVTIDGSQNVGIGTSSPLSKFVVSNAGAAGFEINPTGSASAPALYSYNRTTSAYDVLTFVTSEVRWQTGSSPSERMRIDSSGNLLVGTTNAGGRTATIVNTSWYTTTTAAGANMVVASDGTVYRSTSALKYKQDVRDLESIDINKFRPVRYKSNAEFDDQDKDYFGVIADEVDKAGIKELVNYGADGEVEGFQYERLTVVLLKAIQELNAKLEAQALEIQALKGVA